MELQTHWILLFILVACQLFIKSYGQDLSQTRGWPKPYDTIDRRVIQKDFKLFETVTYHDTINSQYIVNAVRFWDVWKNGAHIWMLKEPPYYRSTFLITSAWSRGFKFNMEIFYDKRITRQPKRINKRKF